MNKKVLCIGLVLALACASVFASFAGRTSVGINYGWNDGMNMFGITTDSVGYVNNGPVGYYIGTDADFVIGDVADYRIGMIIGPSYSYDFKNTQMSVEVAAGASASFVSQNTFSFGLGGYIGAAWHFTEAADLMLGAKLGSNFVDVNTNNGKFSLSGDFFVVPTLAIGFNY